MACLGEARRTAAALPAVRVVLPQAALRVVALRVAVLPVAVLPQADLRLVALR
jgi:hypothetical protein